MLSRGVKFTRPSWIRHVLPSLQLSTNSTADHSPPPSYLDFSPNYINTNAPNIQKLVGYPVPLLSLRHLLGHELTQNLVAHVQKLFSSRHPIVKNARTFVNNYNLPYSHGMLTLLASKCFNSINQMLPDVDQFGILPSQRALAEITELIHIADMIHHEVVNLPVEDQGTETMKDLSFGNKLIVLGGDILLARACKDLALLYKPQIVHLMSQAISDINLKRFLTLSTTTHPSNQVQANSLLGKSYQSSAILAELDEKWQHLLFELGIHLSALRQVLKQTHLQKKGSEDYHKMCKYHSRKALAILNILPDSESKLVIEDYIINSIIVN